eukprot:COSAG04_NODE_2201_length_4544_cov_29.319685_2_plen_1071_part_01
MKRKRERKVLMDQMKDVETSSDEDVGDVVERPPCVDQMPAELKELLQKQMSEFMEQLTAGIEDPGENQERLENLTSDFNKLLYHGFIQNKGFYPLDHQHKTAPVRRAQSIQALLAEDDDDDGLPDAVHKLRQLRDNPWFKNFVVLAILVAGINIGISTYLDCGQDENQQDYTSCYADTLGGLLYAESEVLTGNFTQAQCAAAKGCFEPADVADVNSTMHCWAKGPLPECYTGETAGSILHTLEAIDFAILLVFTFECILKLLCEFTKPWLFCKDLWNVFDLIIVVLCYLPAGGNVAVLRLLRLARLLKLLHAVEDLQVILSGLTAGFGSIGYILILLLLVFYLFAIIAWMLFAENDPVEFKDLDTAMVTLFRMSTMEDWTDVMYINMYGCMSYSYGSFCYDAEYCSENGDPRDTCTPQTSHAMGYPAAIFFIAFIVVSGYVVMSLFIGVITSSMQTETDKHIVQKRAAKQEKSKKKVYETLEARRATGEVVRPSVDLLSEDGHDIDMYVRPTHSSPVIEQYLVIGDQCERAISSPKFQHSITVCIMVAAILIGCQTYQSMVDVYGPEMDTLDALILAVFTLEIMLKLVAARLRPWEFFLDPWNSFDFFVVVMCYVPFPGDSGDSVAVLRLLRLLRVLKLFKTFPQLQIIMSGLAKGMGSIGYIALLLIFLIYVFGIIAIMFFRANDPVHFGSLGVTFVTLFRASTFEDWTDVMYIAMYGCKKWSYGEFDFRCENNESFGLIAAAFFILFILFSALIMLNLVIGSICSSMSDAQERYEIQASRREDIQKLVGMTVARGKDYNLPGISHDVIGAWLTEFEKLDSASSALALEAAIHKDDLEILLELIGEQKTLKVKTVQQLHIKANHTLPVGLIDSMTFLEALAMDLMSVRIKELSDTTGWIVVKSCDGLKSEAITERNQSGSVIDRAMNSLDPYCVVVLNGEEVGRTHTLSHTGENPEWNERIGFPMQLLRSTKNTFTFEVMDMDVGRDDLLGTATVFVNGKTNFAEVEKLTDYPLVPDPKAKRKDAVLGASIQMQIVPPRASLQSTVKKVKTGLSSVRDLSGFIGAKAGSS